MSGLNKNSLTVIHNEAGHRFEVHVDSHTAELSYLLQGDTITFTHTGVPSEIEGNGIGSLLVKAGLEYAQTHKLKVVSLCWFVSGYIQRHPEAVK
ncbi:MAG: GNAT family N-acetyltransferase [Anaerolineales bacterium]